MYGIIIVKILERIEELKRIIPIILMLLLLAGCSKQIEHGGIVEINNDEEMVIAESDEHLLFSAKDKPDLNFETFYDYYAGFSIPYPKEWTLSVVSPNYITIYNGDNMIVIHHRLLTKEVAWDEDARIFRDSFQPLLDSEVFNVGMYSGIHRRQRQNLDELTVVNNDPVLISERYDNAKMTTGLGDYISKKLSEKRYYLRYNSIDTVISIMSVSDKKEAAYEIIDYMATNIREADIRYEKRSLITSSTASIEVPNSFLKRDLALENYSGSVYMPDKNDAFAGCFILKLPLMDAYNYENVKKIFQAAFSSVQSCTCNESSLQLFDLGGECRSCYCIVSGGDNNSLTPIGTAWNLEINQTDSEVIVIGYPVAKTELMRKLSEQQNSAE